MYVMPDVTRTLRSILFSWVFLGFSTLGSFLLKDRLSSGTEPMLGERQAKNQMSDKETREAEKLGVCIA
nr:hypothetical protein CFP56_33538 [Quercus suber]